MTVMSKILVSIIVPVYNCVRYVKEAINSALNQTMGEFEIIIVDDGSTDGTAAVISTFICESRVRLIWHKCNMGVAYSRNEALILARGKFICFLDGDDVWLPDKLEKQLKFIQQWDYDICYTAYDFIDKNGFLCGKTYQVPEKISWKELLYENVIGCSTVMCATELFSDCKFRAEYAHEDYVLWLELLQNGYLAGGLQEVLVRYRLLPKSRSGNKKKAAINRWKIYRKFLGLNLYQAIRAFLLYLYFGIKKYLYR